MAQASNLTRQYDENTVESFKVGAVDMVANRLYKRDTDDTLIIAGANEANELYVPLVPEAAGKNVGAYLAGAGNKGVIMASGSIAKGALVESAASGKIKTAVSTERAIGRAWNAAADGELVTAVFAVEGVA